MKVEEDRSSRDNDKEQKKNWDKMIRNMFASF